MEMPPYRNPDGNDEPPPHVEPGVAVPQESRDNHPPRRFACLGSGIVSLRCRIREVKRVLSARFGHLVEPLVAPIGFDWEDRGRADLRIPRERGRHRIARCPLWDREKETLSATILADPGFSPAIALSLMVFVLLYTPCVAVVGVIKKETQSWKWTGFSVVYGLIVAWILAFVIGRLAPFFLGVHNHE